MSEAVYGCHNRQPYGQVYFATGGREPIRHVTTTECQYRHTELGKGDQKCNGCRWREEQAVTP